MALSQQDALSLASEFSDRAYLVAISLMTTLANTERTQEPMIPAFQEKMMERGILFVERFFAGYEHGRSLDAVAALQGNLAGPLGNRLRENITAVEVDALCRRVRALLDDPLMPRPRQRPRVKRWGMTCQGLRNRLSSSLPAEPYAYHQTTRGG